MEEILQDTKVMAMILAAAVTLLGSLIALGGVIWSQRKQSKNIDKQIKFQQESLENQLNAQRDSLDKQLTAQQKSLTLQFENALNLQKQKESHEIEVVNRKLTEEADEKFYLSIHKWHRSLDDLISYLYRYHSKRITVEHYVKELKQQGKSESDIWIDKTLNFHIDEMNRYDNACYEIKNKIDELDAQILMLQKKYNCIEKNELDEIISDTQNVMDELNSWYSYSDIDILGTSSKKCRNLNTKIGTKIGTVLKFY